MALGAEGDTDDRLYGKTTLQMSVADEELRRPRGSECRTGRGATRTTSSSPRIC